MQSTVVMKESSLSSSLSIPPVTLAREPSLASGVLRYLQHSGANQCHAKPSLPGLEPFSLHLSRAPISSPVPTMMVPFRWASWACYSHAWGGRDKLREEQFCSLSQYISHYMLGTEHCLSGTYSSRSVPRFSGLVQERGRPRTLNVLVDPLQRDNSGFHDTPDTR